MKLMIEGSLTFTKHKTGIGKYTNKLFYGMLKKRIRVSGWNIDAKESNYCFLNRIQSGIFRKILYFIWLNIYIPFRKEDIMHFTNFICPIIKYKSKYIVTWHDMHVFKLRKIKYYMVYRFIILKIVANVADIIICPSEYTKKDIMKIFPETKGKIRVIYHGVGRALINKNVILRKDIGTKYLLAVGPPGIRKNIEGVIEAFKIVSKRYPELKLVITGKVSNYYYKNKLKKIMDKSICNKKIKFVGHVEIDYLSSLYKNALVVLYVSFYEGFGFPGLEAMAHGVPLISSNKSCLPEIYGRAAEYVDPSDIKDIANKILLLIEDEKRKKELVNLGYKRVTKFSWENTINETYKAYKEVLK